MSSSPSYHYEISQFYQDKARQELHENPQQIHMKLNELRELIISNNSTPLNFNVSDHFLIQFLRYHQWNVTESFQHIQMHYSMKKEMSEIFDNLTCDKINDLLEDGVSNILPHRDRNGSRIVIYRPGKWNPHKSHDDILDLARLNAFIFSQLVQEEETQICGMSFIVDLSEMSFKHMFNITRKYIEIQRDIILCVIPIRINKVYFLHGGMIFDQLYSLMSTMISENLLKYVMNCCNDVTILHEELCQRNNEMTFDTSILPNDVLFGGSGQYSLPCRQIIDEFNKRSLTQTQTHEDENSSSTRCQISLNKTVVNVC